jgi:hypothetical protein
MATVYLRLPRVGGTYSMFVLFAEIGDDSERFGTTKNVRAFAGTSCGLPGSFVRVMWWPDWFRIGLLILNFVVRVR